MKTKNSIFYIKTQKKYFKFNREHMKKQKLTNEQIIKLKKTKKPPYLIYNVLGGIWKLLFFKKYGVSVKFNYDFRKE